MTYKASGPTWPGALFQNMNEIMKCVEMLRELLREQIKRNTDLHLMLSEQFSDLNEARRERDAAWEELDTLKERMKEEAK